MENKNIEFSVDPREFQMNLIMNLPKNTPKAAMEVIREIQKERDFLLEQNEKFKNSSTRESESTPEDITNYMKELEGEIEDLKENQLTEDSAMDYIYHYTNQYETWIEGSDLYKNLKEEHEKLKEEIKDCKVDVHNRDGWLEEINQIVGGGQYPELVLSNVNELKDGYEKLKEDHGQLKLLAEPMFRVILNHENN